MLTNMIFSRLLFCFLLLYFCGGSWASPEQDRNAVTTYYLKRFPALDAQDYINGAYALSEAAYQQWQEIEEFPPYEFAMEEGQDLFETPFADGAGYGECFNNGGIGVRQDFPYFDREQGEVITLELAINQCRADHGEPPLPYRTGDMAALSAYMAYTSRDKMLNIKVEGAGTSHTLSGIPLQVGRDRHTATAHCRL